MKAFVTGGAGFIGSHLVDALLAKDWTVTVYDNLSTGSLGFLECPLGLNGNSKDPRLEFVKGDLLDEEKLLTSLKGHEVVFHLAANADVRGGPKNTKKDFQQNTVATHNVLEAMRVNDVRNLIFTSSAVVYGEPEVFPTPEGYRSKQTSLYGASKLAAEALIEAYANYYDQRVQTFRFVSLLGERYTHGVVFDFVKKLKADPRVLEILGDGNQKKSYLYVGDAISGILTAFDHHQEHKGVHVYNLGNRRALNVCEVASLVTSELGLPTPKYHFTGGARGWVGDSPYVHLDTSKLEGLGWRPGVSIEDGVRRTTRYLMDHPEHLKSRSLGDPVPQVFSARDGQPRETHPTSATPRAG